MEAWPKTRVERAQHQPIACLGLEVTEDGVFIFSIQGCTGEYTVEINENIEMWPPSCNCEDSFWRGELSLMCKHIMYV